MAEKSKKEFVVLHESLLESWLKDFFTFGSIALLLFANFRWFGDHAIVALAFVILIIIFSLGRASKSIHNFCDKEAAKKYIENL